MKSILVLGAVAAVLLSAAASPAQAGWHGGRGYYGGWHGGYYRGWSGYRAWWGPRFYPPRVVVVPPPVFYAPPPVYYYPQPYYYAQPLYR
nr:hypothetical protein [uncultured Rhodopila sp.]